jgi:L-malate glycosyltransferase
MPNILQLVISPPLTNNKNSITGPERRAARLASRWKFEDIHVTVCYPSRGRLNNDFKNANLKVIDFEIGNKFNFLSIFKLKKIIKDHQIDLVHSQGPASLDLFLALASKLIKVKTVITRPVMLKDQIHYSKLKIKLYEFFDKYFTLKIINKIIAVSQDGYDVLKNKYNVSENKLQLIYNGIDVNKIIPVKKNEISKIKFGMVGQLFPPKGWHDFIYTVDYIYKKSYKQFQALIIGEGEQMEELKSLVIKLNLEDVISFEGYVDSINSKLKELDFILFTTHREGFSVAILEAMSAGLPQVITDVGGGKEQIIHGENGYVVKCGEIETMGDYCLKLMNDKSLRVLLGAKSRELVEKKFSEDAMFKNHVNLYKKLLKS